MSFCRIVFLVVMLVLPYHFVGAQTYAQNGMVVSEQYLASQVGIKILKAGGNAVDAAVAVGYALAVVDPCCGNIGGGGFMLIRMADGKNIFINFREKAGQLVSKDIYSTMKSDASSVTGYSSVAVPGTVLGLDTALKRYGSFTRQQVMQPAIDLAKNGFKVTAYEAKRYATYVDLFKQQPNVSAIFLRDNHPLQQGDILKQKDLAKTLSLISSKGSDVFYKGVIAQEIVSASQRKGGYLTLKDFAKYNVEITQPLQCSYHGYTVLTSPLPGSGVTLCEMLGILQNFPLSKLGYLSSDSVKNIVEAMRFSFADRNTTLGDPHFMFNPTDRLLSKQYLLSISQKIKAEKTAPHASQSIPLKELTDTTHYSVIDKKGNAVAVTYTLNGFFGSGVIAGDTGFFLNNVMDDFTTRPGIPNKFGLIQNDTNRIQSGKRPLSSMIPTIVLKNNKVYLIVGSPGGPRIISAVLLTLLNILDYRLELQSAIDAPRFHFQGQPDSVSLEPGALSPVVMNALKKWGYDFQIESTWAAVAAILVNERHQLVGAMDVRRPDGASVGY